MENILLTTDHFDGCYVILRSFQDKTIIASGQNPSDLFEKAKKMGVENPAIIYVPERDVVSIY